MKKHWESASLQEQDETVSLLRWFRFAENAIGTGHGGSSGRGLTEAGLKDLIEDLKSP